MKNYELKENLEYLHKKYIKTNNIVETLNSLHTLINVLLEYKHYNRIYYIFYLLGSVYTYGLDDKINGVIYYEKSLKFSKNTNNTKDTFLIAKKLIINYIFLNNIEKAERYYQIAYDSFSINELEIYKGIIEYKKGNINKAKQLLESYTLGHLVNFDNMLAKLYLAKIYKELDDYNKLEETESILSENLDNISIDIETFPLLLELLKYYAITKNENNFILIYTKYFHLAPEFRVYKQLIQIMLIKIEFSNEFTTNDKLNLGNCTNCSLIKNEYDKNLNLIINKIEVLEKDLRTLAQFETGDLSKLDIVYKSKDIFRIYSTDDFQKFLHYDINYLSIKNISFMFLEVKDFLNYSKLYGENTSNQLTMKLVELIRKVIRIEDIIFSYDKSKFILLFKDVSLMDAQNIGKKIRISIENLLEGNQEKSAISLSLAIKTLNIEENEIAVEDVMELAHDIFDSRLSQNISDCLFV